MNRSRHTFAARIAIAVAALGATAAIAHSSEPPAWKHALELRSQALDQRYNGAMRNALQPRPDWPAELRARTEALSHLYPASDQPHTSQARWHIALMERSDGLDRAYHLGRYAPAP